MRDVFLVLIFWHEWESFKNYFIVVNNDNIEEKPKEVVNNS